MSGHGDGQADATTRGGTLRRLPDPPSLVRAREGAVRRAKEEPEAAATDQGYVPSPAAAPAEAGSAGPLTDFEPGIVASRPPGTGDGDSSSARGIEDAPFTASVPPSSPGPPTTGSHDESVSERRANGAASGGAAGAEAPTDAAARLTAPGLPDADAGAGPHGGAGGPRVAAVESPAPATGGEGGSTHSAPPPTVGDGAASGVGADAAEQPTAVLPRIVADTPAMPPGGGAAGADAPTGAGATAPPSMPVLAPPPPDGRPAPAAPAAPEAPAVAPPVTPPVGAPPHPATDGPSSGPATQGATPMPSVGQPAPAPYAPGVAPPSAVGEASPHPASGHSAQPHSAQPQPYSGGPYTPPNGQRHAPLPPPQAGPHAPAEQRGAPYRAVPARVSVPVVRPELAGTEGKVRHGDTLARRTGRYFKRMLASSSDTAAVMAAVQAIQQPVPSGRQIAVTSIRGGSGKSTVAALLALTFAHHRTDPVIAVEADPALGTLPRRLGATEVRWSCADLARILDPSMQITDLIGYLLPFAGGGWLLPGSQGAVGTQLDLDTYRIVMTSMRRYFAATVVDCETLPAEVARTALTTTQARVLVAPATVEGVAATGTVLEWLGGLHRSMLPTTVVALTHMSPDSTLDVRRSTELLQRGGAHVVSLPYDRHLAGGGAIRTDLLSLETQEAAARLGGAVMDRAATR